MSTHRRQSARGQSRSRLSSHLTVAARAEAAGRAAVTSEELALHAKTFIGRGSPTRIRFELKRLGVGGKRGVGYEVHGLIADLDARLHRRRRSVVVVGTGGVSRALIESELLPDRAIEICGVADPRPEQVGERLGQFEVMALEDLSRLAASRRIDAGVIATSSAAAQAAHDAVAATGARLVVSFSDALLERREGVRIHYVHPAPALLATLTR